MEHMQEFLEERIKIYQRLFSKSQTLDFKKFAARVIDDYSKQLKKLKEE